MFFPELQRQRIRLAARIFLGFLLVGVADFPGASSKSQSANASATGVPVLVSDFELFSVTPPPNSPASPAPAPNQQKQKTPLALEDVEVPSVQAHRLADFFAVTLVETLRKRGFNTRRTAGQNPPKGALLRGVFAEPDEKNRIRRALLGGSSVNSKFFLYVGISNLARPDQPLYQLAPEQPGSKQLGPVITLNNYIPLAKYELDKNPTEEDIRKICAQIAASLAAILAANPDATSQ